MNHLYNVNVSKCSGSCNNINNPYTKLWVPDVSENMNVKVFNLISRTNETRCIKWHETCKYKCRLDASVVIINKDGVKINADVNAKSWSTKECVMKDLTRILAIVNVNCKFRL